MDKVRVIAFDLNGTIVTWQEPFEQAFREAVSEWLGRWSEDEQKESAVQQMLHHYQEKRRRKYGKMQSIKSSLSLLPFDAGRKTAAQLIEHITALQHAQVRWMEGAESALEQLASDYRLLIATHSTPEKVDKMVRQLDLQRFVKKHDIFTPDTIKCHKSYPLFYRKIADRLDLPSRQCVMVGNSLKNDIASAKRAGWNTVWVHNKARRLSIRQEPRGRMMAQMASISLLPKLFE
jgi:HAD superfamily hydrolase (TIGR01549 family)